MKTRHIYLLLHRYVLASLSLYKPFLALRVSMSRFPIFIRAFGHATRDAAFLSSMAFSRRYIWLEAEARVLLRSPLCSSV